MTDTAKKTGLTPERERMNLFLHGTIPWKLTPATILETAKADIRSREINAEIRRARQNFEPGSLGRKSCGTIRKYAFLDQHVKASTTPADLLRAAIEDRASGFASENVNSLAIYSDKDGLWAALELAGVS
jgi:hypothetical protein